MNHLFIQKACKPYFCDRPSLDDISGQIAEERQSLTDWFLYLGAGI